MFRERVARADPLNGCAENGEHRGSGYRIRSAKAALTSGLAWSAPSTEIEEIVARASSGVTSAAMLTSPSTLR